MPPVSRLQPGVRTRLFGVSLALLLTGGGLVGSWLDAALREELSERIDAELYAHAASGQVLLDAAQPGTDPDLLADRLGEAAGARITVIGPDGRVEGDSELSPAEIALLENHGDRPEVVQARAEGRGAADRESSTLGLGMSYRAVTTRSGQIVRVARERAYIDRAARQLRVILGWTALALVGVAAAMSALASELLSRVLSTQVERLRALSGGPVAQVDAVGPGTPRRSVGGLSAQLDFAVGSLASQRARFQAVLQGMSEAVVALDRERRITLLNRSGLRMLGLAEPPLGEPLAQVFPLPELQRLATAATREPGERQSVEFELKDPLPRRLLARASGQSDGGVVIVLLDVTELRRLEAVRRDFVANVSHELRTPVSVIQANAETLLDGALDEPKVARRFTEALYRHAERLGRLISDLLDIARIEAGRYEFRAAATRLHPIALAVIEAVRGQAQARSVALHLAIEPAAEVMADPKALEQVFLNLVENAVKYTQEGGSVWIRARDRGASLRLEIADNGPGIAEEKKSRVFERFYRIDPGRSRDLGGTGLGLAIVKHLVEGMGGRVGVEDTEGGGATFYATLQRPRVSGQNLVNTMLGRSISAGF